MNQQSVPGPSLFDLLGRSWQRPGAIEAISFSLDGTAIAFASADGTIAIAKVAEAEPPESRIRISSDLGQMRILPRSKPAPPLIALPVQGEGAPPLAAYLQSDFLYGAATGAVARLTSQGETAETLFRIEQPVVTLDHAARSGIVAASDGERLHVARRSGDLLIGDPEAGSSIKAVSISPDGGQIAGLVRDGLAVWSLDGDVLALRMIVLPSPPISIRWSRDGNRIACGLEAGGYSVVEMAGGRTDTVLDFPAPVRTVSWSDTAGALVASGAFRIAAWSMPAAKIEASGSGALVTGRAGLVLVDAVAAHPGKNLVAAGYANGRIVVARIGERDELSVRLEGGSVTALEWSADGEHLAIGDAEGNASIVTFPPQLFK